jgi:hypothetical protein
MQDCASVNGTTRAIQPNHGLFCKEKFGLCMTFADQVARSESRASAPIGMLVYLGWVKAVEALVI